MNTLTLESRGCVCNVPECNKKRMLHKEQWQYVLKRDGYDIKNDTDVVIETLKNAGRTILGIEYEDNVCIIKYEISDEEIENDKMNHI